MIKILGLYPLQGNGGIASWTKKFLATFPNEEFVIIPINTAPDKDFTKYTGSDRLRYGIKAFLRIRKNIKNIIENQTDIDIMHITTSGGLGVIRDNFVARMCKKKGIKTVMHCRFGSIKELYEGKGLKSRIFRNNTNLFDSIWVLDRRSATYLRTIPQLGKKIELTPNSIEVPNTCDLQPKKYNKVGFVGNIVLSKGIIELTKAVVSLGQEVELFIAGQGLEVDINQIKAIAGDALGKSIHLLGHLNNSDAVRLVESLDIICLPTYYPGEAFPISILEAMSRGKLVVSCPRAAIPDMLTALDKSMCGILVPEKNSEAIKESIIWIISHKKEADNMCKKAYEKVKACYSTEVVYDIYKDNYRKLVCKNNKSNNSTDFI